MHYKRKEKYFHWTHLILNNLTGFWPIKQLLDSNWGRCYKVKLLLTTHTVCTHLIGSSWAKTHSVDWKTKHAVTEDVFESFTLSEHCCCLKNISEILKPPSFPHHTSACLQLISLFFMVFFKKKSFIHSCLYLLSYLPVAFLACMSLTDHCSGADVWTVVLEVLLHNLKV